MNCEEANNLIVARMDGEISAEDTLPLEAHLDQCAPCRGVAEELALQEPQLLRAFGQRRESATAVAQRVIWTLKVREVETENAARRRISPPPNRLKIWTRTLLAAAAGFLLAVGLFRPWKADVPPLAGGKVIPSNVATTQPAGQLSLATGAVFTCTSNSQTWRPLETGGDVECGAKVRTGPKVQCEFKMADGSEVRLNAQTQVTLTAPRRLEVENGQVFSSVRPAAEAFVVSTAAGATMTALGTAFDVACSPANSTLTVVEGSVKVTSAGAENVIRGGESLTIADGKMGDKKTIDNLMRATQWVDEILVLKGRDNPELAKRIDDIFAQLGHEKMWYMHAQEVRRLGDRCVVPLARYIQSDRSKKTEDTMKRREAARIIGDVATTWAIPELINLLADEDGDVRFAAARALDRLTGQNQGQAPAAWRDEERFSCEPAIARWHAWWEKNKRQFPGANPEGVKPLEVAKDAPSFKKG